MRIFAGDFVKSMMERLGMKEGEAIESNLVTRRIAAAQKKVEERNYEIRKSLLDYDEVMDEQRKRVYRYRQNLLDGHSSRKMILDLIQRSDRQVRRDVPGSQLRRRLVCRLRRRTTRLPTGSP